MRELAKAEPTVDNRSEDKASKMQSYVAACLATCGDNEAKKIALTNCSLGQEERASTAASERISYGREYARALGDPQLAPTQLSSDTHSNMQVATRRGNSSRSKHLLRRYYNLQQLIFAGELNMYHLPTDQNPADFLTKFVPAKKLQKSLRYCTGGARRDKAFIRSAIAVCLPS